MVDVVVRILDALHTVHVAGCHLVDLHQARVEFSLLVFFGLPGVGFVEP